MGSFLESKNGLGHQTCPKTAPRGATPEITSLIWTHLGSHVRTFSHFSVKNNSSEICLFFSSDVRVALSAPRDGLICNPYTPAQSKHTFLFSQVL